MLYSPLQHSLVRWLTQADYQSMTAPGVSLKFVEVLDCVELKSRSLWPDAECLKHQHSMSVLAHMRVIYGNASAYVLVFAAYFALMLSLLKMRITCKKERPSRQDKVIKNPVCQLMLHN